MILQLDGLIVLLDKKKRGGELFIAVNFTNQKGNSLLRPAVQPFDDLTLVLSC